LTSRDRTPIGDANAQHAKPLVGAVRESEAHDQRAECDDDHGGEKIDEHTLMTLRRYAAASTSEVWA
jgi:hypothetical protein